MSSVAAFGSLTVSGDPVYYGFPDEYEIRILSQDGVLEGIVRKEHEPVPITASGLERMRAEELAAAQPEAYPEMRARFASEDPPESMPTFSSIIVDDVDNLWVQEYSDVRSTLPGAVRETWSPWSVFDSAGRYLGVVNLPPRLRVTQIGANFVLGVHVDDLGVQSVRRYRLLKDTQ